MENLLKEKKIIEIIPNLLYWLSSNEEPKGIQNAKYFNTDEIYEYEPYFKDFGPLNILQTVYFSRQINKFVNHFKGKNTLLIHHTSELFEKKANSAWLMCSFMLLCLKKSSEEIWEIFKKIDLKPFRDASYNISCSHKLYIYDCLRGLEYATKLGWFDLDTFNTDEYEKLEKLDNGDLNWIIPNKILAFSSPVDETSPKYDDTKNTYVKMEKYVEIFKELNVNLVIRLNTKTYDKKKFEDNGIKVKELFFQEKKCPEDNIIREFIDCVENENNNIAVHCKAGLGRTGSLLAMYCMKNYKFKGRDFIGWIRLCRPGSVLGPQQNFILSKEGEMNSKQSNIFKSIQNGLTEFKEFYNKFNNLNIKEKIVFSNIDKGIMKNGQKDQGGTMNDRKRNKKKFT